MGKKEKGFMAGSSVMLLGSGRGSSGAPTGVPSSSTLASGVGVGTELFGDALRKARKDALKSEGLYRPRQKYKDKEERKAAAKARAKERREKKKNLLIAKGLGPRPKKKYESVEKRKEAAKGRRKERRVNKRQFIIEVAKDNPELAAKYGIDLSKFKLFG